jgi:hypothetical protein
VDVVVSIHAPALGPTVEVVDPPQKALISIHAPARSATGLLVARMLVGAVSIHAPARSATPRTSSQPRLILRFNPRTRAGCDRRSVSGPTRLGCFNPCAGTGRDLTTSSLGTAATTCFNPRAFARRDCGFGSCCRSRAPCFNPRARARRDWLEGGHRVRINRFQSTCPRRARLQCLRIGPSSPYRFNPRARAGRDPDAQARPPNAAALSSWKPMFQSTRPYGARLQRCRVLLVTTNVSIHTPALGATRRWLDLRVSTAGFNPRPRRARLSASWSCCSSTWSFNPRARTERDVTPARCGAYPVVSIHAPALGATLVVAA